MGWVLRPTGRIRLGSVTSIGLEVVEIDRPHPQTVRRGYGRMWVGFDNGQGFAYYPSDRLAIDDNQPPDPTMDEWDGRWWPTDDIPLRNGPVDWAGA